ncbi:MAG TPA: type II toxin-antitoxin system HipA family toxin [Terriglobales bacterium]|nr:type II toxin-antitoxin system HipA family toxin [Terriglobales bacterium]
MARHAANAPLNVFLNARLVGRLSRETTGAIDFQYDGSWLQWENAFPVSLSLTLREDRYVGAPVTAVFDNLLPDNDDIRRRLAARTGAKGHDAYSLLAAIGRDCVGALQFLPQGEEPGPAGTVEGRPIANQEIAGILHELSAAPLGVSREGEFRISIAGAQEKTALLRWKRRWWIPHGSAATTHIFKPAIGQRGNLDLSLSVENEHFCMTFAAGLGLPVARTQIARFGAKPVLIVERFDRRWTADRRLLRLPQEDFCQALSFPPSRKYESHGGPGIVAILELLKGSDDPQSDQRMFLKAQIVFWLLGAIDGHAKNFSVALRPGGRFRLTPLYDIVSVQPNLDAHQLRHNRMKLAMAVGKNRHYAVATVFPRHFIQTAETAGVAAEVTISILREVLEQVPSALTKAKRSMPQRFPKKLLESIKEGVLRRLGRVAQSPEIR